MFHWLGTSPRTLERGFQVVLQFLGRTGDETDELVEGIFGLYRFKSIA
ncbi:hypothetical protein ACIBO5_58765 [Nonomuraea angiospora]|nr:hypothetical protein [Nonomuraea angiospora]